MTLFGHNFLNMTPKAQDAEVKIDKWDYIKLEICKTKETINKVKRQPKEGIFSNHVSYKELISRIHEFLQLDNKK